jgi:dynein heavy chain
LASEAKTFAQIQTLYNSTVNGFKEAPQVYMVAKRENFLPTLIKHNSDCDHIRQGLRDFLEKKRGKFPRFFFLSNEELIDIFGKGPALVEWLDEDPSRSFIQNIFEGIDQIRFTEVDKAISHIIAKDGEELVLKNQVMTRGGVQVDTWLKFLEQRMKQAVKDGLFHAYEGHWKQDTDEWVGAWCGQALFVASQIWYSASIKAVHTGVEQARDEARRLDRGTDHDDDAVSQVSRASKASKAVSKRS